MQLELRIEGGLAWRGLAPARSPGTSPRPRMSPTCGCSPKAACRRWRRPSPWRCTRSSRRSRADHLLHGQRRGAGHRMADVGVAMLEQAAAARECLDQPRLRQHRADRLVAAAQSLGDHQQVGHHAFLLAGVQACRCGPCRTSPRRGSAGCRGGRTARARRAGSRAPASARRRWRRPPSRRRRRSPGRRRARRWPRPARRPAAAPYGLGRLVVRAVAVLVARRHVRHRRSAAARTGARRHSLPPTASAPSVLP